MKKNKIILFFILPFTFFNCNSHKNGNVSNSSDSINQVIYKDITNNIEYVKPLYDLIYMGNFKNYQKIILKDELTNENLYGKFSLAFIIVDNKIVNSILNFARLKNQEGKLVVDYSDTNFSTDSINYYLLKKQDYLEHYKGLKNNYPDSLKCYFDYLLEFRDSIDIEIYDTCYNINDLIYYYFNVGVN